MKTRHPYLNGKAYTYKFGDAWLKYEPHLLSREDAKIVTMIRMFYKDKDGELIYIANLIPFDSKIPKDLLDDMKTKLRKGVVK